MCMHLTAEAPNTWSNLTKSLHKTLTVSIKWNKFKQDPTIPLLSIYPREIKFYVHMKTCTRLFMPTLFIISPNWKQSNLTNTSEWMNNLCTSIRWNTNQYLKNELLIHNSLDESQMHYAQMLHTAWFLFYVILEKIKYK